MHASSEAKIKFYGHEVDGERIHTSDDKIKAIKNFPKPQSVDNVCSFPGLAGYYRPFIHNFAAKAAPLTKLLKKESTFHWGATQGNSFQELKYMLTHMPLLALPDYKDPFIMRMNASTLGLGAVHMQCSERGKNHAIAYASHTRNLAEAIYSITHLETLMVVWGLNHFLDIILGYMKLQCSLIVLP